VYGAVLVEAVPFPRGSAPAGPAALLQVWPEPQLQWLATRGVTAGATDAAGARLPPEAARVAPPQPGPRVRGGLAVVRNADGTARFVEELTPAGREFAPNPRQALLRFKAADEPPAAAKELDVSLFATVRSEVEPLSVARGLEPNAPATGTGPAAVEMTVRCGKNAAGKLTADVTLSFDRSSVQSAGVGIELPGVKGGGPGVGNHAVYGVRVTDADGKPFTLGLVSGASHPGRDGREVMILSLELHPDRGGQGVPTAVTFWGTYAKPVEVPVVLKDVPLSKSK
jgi:hypothetical protein